MTCFTPEQIAWARRMEAKERCRYSDLILYGYRLPAMRRHCLRACYRFEGGRFFSATLRRILFEHHGVCVGRYSYGPCLVPGALPRGTIVGAYCSIAEGLHVHRRNHPPNTLSQHPFFYNSSLGLLEVDRIERVEDNPLVIGNDVWIGDRVTVLSGCRRIADGAVVGAGSVVTRDVEPYSIVVGNPAKRIRQRYPDEVAAELQRSRWWTLSLPDLLAAEALLLEPIELESLRCFVDALKSQTSDS